MATINLTVDDSTVNFNLTIDDTGDTVALTVTDGIFVDQNGGLKFIDGFLVKKKDSPSTPNSIEVGDQVFGFIGTTAIGGTVTNVPITTTSDINPAIEGTPFG